MTELINSISKGNKRAFSNLVGVTPTVIENIVGTRKGKPGYELLEKIAFAIEYINLDWLLTGRGSMLRSDQTQPDSQTVAQPIEATVYYNMYKEEKADNKALIEEIGALKLKISQLEAGDLGGKTTAKTASTKKPSSLKIENADSASVQ